MSSGGKILDLVKAWEKRGRVVPMPRPPGEPLTSTLGARARTVGRQLVVDVLDLDAEIIGTVVYTPEVARTWANYLLAFAGRCAMEDVRKDRVTKGLCASLFCKRKLVAGTERCRKCGLEEQRKRERSR